MKHGKLARIALLGTALLAFGCSSSGSGGGSGAGGGGGEGGEGGQGGSGGEALACAPAPECENAPIGDAEETCEPALPVPPDVMGACTGDEDLDPPDGCTPTETLVTHQLTRLAILADCNIGYDLDRCDGRSCQLGSPAAPGEGMGGVDNGLAGLQERLDGTGGDLANVNQAFYDAICDGRIDIKLLVNMNFDENCALVGVESGGRLVAGAFFNASDAVDGEICLSGALGTLPIDVGGEAGEIGNTRLRVTVVPDTGFSSGVLGGTLDSATASSIAEAISPGAGTIVDQFLDITDELDGNTSEACDALSMTFDIGGVAIVGP